MSNKMLAPKGTKRKQTLQDDMESLLYVVLYCSFLWLPHNLSKDELARTIKRLFEYADFYYGDYQGGDGKLENAVDREHTRSVKFNPALKEWLDTVMDYYYPPSHLVQEYLKARKWSDPNQLDKFWTTFLQTHTLPANDRVMHDHPHATEKYEPGADAGSSPSTEAITLGKRDPDNEPVDHESLAPARKKSRNTASVFPTMPPRRSQRIREKSATANAAAPPPLPRASRFVSKKQLTRKGRRAPAQTARGASRK